MTSQPSAAKAAFVLGVNGRAEARPLHGLKAVPSQGKFLAVSLDVQHKGRGDFWPLAFYARARRLLESSPVYQATLPVP
jgi:hypothetical protein